MFREMRRHKQQLSTQECERILTEEPRGVIALLGDDGYPYSVPLNFVYADGRLYFHSALEGHKIDAIRAYDKASFCVIDKGSRPEGDWAYYFNSVIAFGRLRELTDPVEREEKLRLLGRKYFPTEQEVEDDIVKNARRAAVIELTIGHLTGKHVHER